MPQLRSFTWRNRCLWCGWIGYVLFLAFAMAVVAARAENGAILAPPAGVVETGAPSFVVLGPESLGLSTAPSDLHVLPDGRILVVSQHEIAIGDGVRWETYQEAADQTGFIYEQVAVDDDGRIYAAIPGAIARIDLGEDAHWRFVPVAEVPHGDPFFRVSQFSDTWLWGPASGTVIAWKPGQTTRTSRFQSVAIEHIFAVGNERFASNESLGLLYQIHLGGDATAVPLKNPLATGGVTDSVDYGAEQVIVGTARGGLLAFDGRSFSDVPVPRILGPGRRINDLCRIGTEFYAAAVDTVGIVFFERGGRLVQVLTRSLDHRLSQVRRLAYAPNGVLWALLDNALVRVQFPSPISDFEPLLASPMGYVKPVRHRGELWVLADRQLLRGVLNPDGYLERFELDMPPLQLLWAIAETGGRLFATSRDGIFVREGTGWQEIAAGITDARVGIGRPQSDGRIFYAARNEIGWLQESAGRFAVDRIPVEKLGTVYNAVTDFTGTVWLELGDHVGRVEFGAGTPTVRIFGKEEGVAGSWAGLFVIDGIARCVASGHILRFEATTQRFVEDQELIRRIPALADCTGRPERDASGRLWFARRGSVLVVDDTKAGEHPPMESLSLGFEPTEFNMESDGVILMQGRGHLVRFDPRLPRVPQLPLRAQITSVQLTGSNQRLFTPGLTLPPLPYSDNSLVVHFAAVSSPFDPPVSFEVLLDGGAKQWVSTGNVGSASFNRLKEGSYVFHVRPIVAGKPGEEARLAFTVRPPWFRTKLAWVIYISAAIGLVLLAAWLFAVLERRETVRLERLVAERTAALNVTNTQLGRQVEETMEKTTALAASEERYRRLNAELESRVNERTAELSNTNADLKTEIAERQRTQEEKEKLQGQLAQAQKMESVGRLAGGVAHDFNNMLQAILGNAALALDDLPPGTPVRENLEEIQKSAQRSAELTRQLLAFARKQTIQPKILDLNDTVAGMLKMLRRLIGEDVNLAWLPGADLWAVRMDPSQIDQILANLCVNARDAIAGVGKVTIETGNVTLAAHGAQSPPDCVPGDYVLLAVSDNGRGMDAATRAHLFEPFFTTKELGKGTGLGLATVFGTVIQNQGLINVDSEPGQGTTFKIYLPRAKAEAVAAAQESARRSLRGTETVLLVEDEEQILNLGRRILQQYGYTVLALSTPQSALALAAQHAGPIHLLITDVVMPGMNGKELRDRLRSSHPQLKCLFMSGYTADVIADNGVLVDGVHFIQKPFTIESLVENVRSVCDAG
jgi:signal transduction histidine kinase/CheY-like chemotaxis protein